ncbi:hypothetical protein [Streptomyces sp. NPDC050428]|uniref:DUF6907 domain-containing protein n=1 Tax=Streptomyces sp. NPDC050428 TaxID=3155757 RepID=UPI003433BBDE
MTVPDPEWCVDPHNESYAALDDVAHRGAAISVSVPRFGGGTAEVLCAAVHQWPFARDDDRGLPYLALDADGSGEVTSLHRSAALAFADQLVAHADQLRARCGLLDSAP